MGEGRSTSSRPRRGARRAREALRARQGVGQARRRLQTQADAATDDSAKKVAALQQLGLLYTEKVENRREAIDAWQRLLDVDGEQPRARTRSRSSTSPKALGRARGVLRARGKIDEYIRVLEREVEAGGRAHQVVARDEDRGALPRRAAEGRSRDARVREGALARRAQPAAGRGADPALRGRPDPRKLVRVLEIQLGHTDASSGARASACGGSPSCQRGAAPRQGRGVRLVAQGARRGSRGRGDPRPSSSGSPQRPAAGPSWSTRTRRRCRSSAPGRRAAAHDGHGARAGEGARRARQGARRRTARSSSSTRATSRRSTRSSGCTSAPSASTSCSGSTRRSSSSRATRQRRTRSTPRSAQLYEDEIKDDKKAIARLPGDPQRRRRRAEALARARSHLRAQRSSGRSCAEIIVRELTIVPPGDNGAHVELKYRLGQLREQHLGDVTGAIDVYRDILDLEPSHAGARTALESAARRRGAPAGRRGHPRADLRAAPRSGRALVDVHEIQLAAREGPPAPRRPAAAHRRAAAYEARRRARRRSTPTPALPRGSVDATARSELEALAPINEAWPQLVSLFEAALEKLKPRGRRTRSCSRELLDQGRRGVRRAAREAGEGGRVLQEGAAHRARRPRRRSRRSSALHARREVARAARGLSPEGRLRRRPHEREQILLPHGLPLGGDARQRRRGDRDVQGDPRRRQRRTSRRCARSIGSTSARQAVARPRRQPDPAAPAHRRQAGAGRAARAARAAARDAARRGRRRRSRPTARCSISIGRTDDARRGARAADRRCPSTSCRSRTILEPIYKARDEWQKLIGDYEIMVRHAFDPARKIELLHQIGELYEIGGEDADGVRDLRARAARGSGPQGDADAARAAGARARSLEGPGALVRLGRRAGGARRRATSSCRRSS